jgi:hypothetical protein
MFDNTRNQCYDDSFYEHLVDKTSYFVLLSYQMFSFRLSHYQATL